MAIINTNKYVALRMRLVSTCRIFPKNTLPTNNPPFRARQILKPGVCVYNLNNNISSGSCFLPDWQRKVLYFKRSASVFSRLCKVINFY